MEFWICFFAVLLFVQSMNRKADIKKLQRQIQWLAQKNNLNLDEAFADIESKNTDNNPEETSSEAAADKFETVPEAKAEDIPVKPAEETRPSESKTSVSGQGIITWIAGFAAVLGFFYFVRYSIENGLLGPEIRLALTALCGFSGIGFGCRLCCRPDIANSRRIGEALSGSGVAALYFAAYALSKIYALAPISVSFVLMCLITAGTIVLTLRFGGQAMAVLALIGGFLTPALAAGEGNVVTFSGYLFILTSALIFMSSHLKSVVLGLLTLAGLYFWIGVLMSGGLVAGNSVWLFCLTAAAAAVTGGSFRDEGMQGARFLQKVSQVFCVAFTFVFLLETDFGLQEWGILAILLSGLTVLTALRVKEYILLLGVSELAAFVLLTVWNSYDVTQKQPVFAVFAAITLVPFYLLSWAEKYRLTGVYVLVAAPLVYFLAHGQFSYLEALPYIALGTAVAFLLPLCRLDLNSDKDRPFAGSLVLSSAALLTMALASLVNAEFWPVVLSLEILLMGTVMTFWHIKKLAAGIVIGLLMFLYCQSGILSAALVVLMENVGDCQSYPEYIGRHFYADGLTLRFYLSQIVVPVLALGGFAFISKDKMLKLFSGILTGLSGFWGVFTCYMLLRMKNAGVASLWMDNWDKTLITNVLLLAGLGCLYARRTLLYKIVLGIGLWRLLVCELLQEMPFFTCDNEVTTGYILYAFGVPMALFCFYARKGQNKTASDLFSRAAALYSFIVVTMLVMNAFYGTVCLDSADFDSRGIFAFSAVWLLLGCIWLAVAFRNRALIKPAFGMIYFVTAKVFLYDVSSLDDIWRIAALFGLAGGLLGISYFYGRYFQKQTGQKHE